MKETATDNVMQVIKRDGRKVNFDKNKIENAILKAFIAEDGDASDYATAIAVKIASNIERDLDGSTPNIEEIQDMVESYLMESERKDIARAYIKYRSERDKIRRKNSALFKEIQEKLSAENIQNQNANVDEASFGGRIGEATDAMMKKIALDYCISDMARENHLNNEIYIHDLNSYAVGNHNCLSIPFDRLLAEGFNTRQTDVRAAQSVNTAFQLVAVIFQLQSLQQFGGVAATHIDHTMVPYVRKSFAKHYIDGLRYIEGTPPDELPSKNELEDLSIDSAFYQTEPDVYEYAMDMTKKEVYQAVEGMYHNLNTLQSRSGNQLPFTSVNYGTCTLPEGRMVTKALLDTSIKGVGKLHKTSIFPCGIFQCMKGINREEGDPNYDLFRLALRSTAQRLYPNYVNVDWSVNAGYDRDDPATYTSTMGGKLTLLPM